MVETRKVLGGWTALLILGAGVIGTMAPKSADAVPAFARQTGAQCISCHSGNFPALNDFGRQFRSNGYTLNIRDTVEGDGLSLPTSMNASLISKIRYQLSEENDGGRGEIQWPDEAALLIGGRAGENIGFLLEAGLGPQGGEADANNPNDDGTHPVEVGGNFLSYKMHASVTDDVSVVMFGTDGLGIGHGMELMNTGLQRSQRPIENRTGYSAAQRTGLGAGTATGLAAVYNSGGLMVNYSHWAPTWGNANANILGGLAHYLRANYFTDVAGWDMGFGAGMMTGSVETGATDADKGELHVDGQMVDFQMLGSLGDMPAEFYASYASAPKSDSDENFYNDSTSDDNTAMGLLGKFGVMSNTSVFVGYGTDEYDGDSTTDTTIGLQQMLAQNVKLELYNVASDSDNDANSYTMLQLFSGF